MMAAKGYIRKNQDAGILHNNIRRLRRAGIPLSAITVGGDITKMIDSLECGDCLVMISASELSRQAARRKILLERIADGGIMFCPLDKAGMEPEIVEENFWERLMCRLGLRRPLPEPTPDPRMRVDLKIKALACLKAYYQLEKGVEAICGKAGISPTALYHFLKEYHLPSRLEVKANPALNPLNDPEFLIKLRETVWKESGTDKKQ